MFYQMKMQMISNIVLLGNMRYVLIFLVFLTSCSVEQRIKEYSYTEKWHIQDGKRYQVYKTKYGKPYIIILNKNQTQFKRKYIK